AGGRETAETLSEVLQAAADAAADIGECAMRETPIATLEKFKAAADRFRSVSAAGARAGLAGLLEDGRHELDALGGQIRAAASVSSSPVKEFEPLSATPSRDPWWLQFPGTLAKLRANLSFRST